MEIHGLVGGTFGYEVGLFNGTGASVNTAGKTISDDWHIPSLLYAARFTYMPRGVMPSTQGSPNRLSEDKMLIGLSGSLNVRARTRAPTTPAWVPSLPGCTANSIWPPSFTT